MVKMIALDLDGTLMYTDHLTVTEGNRNALKFAHEKGAKIAVATGRTLAIIDGVFQQAPEIDYIMYSNGAGVFDRRSNEIICKSFMSFDFCGDILKTLLTEYEAFIELYIDGVDYIDAKRIKYFDGNEILPKEFLEKLTVQMTAVDDLYETARGKEIEKLTIYIPDKKEFGRAWNWLSGIDGIELASSLPISMEFTKKGVNKGYALDAMCKALGITADECMAFGDAGNDCEMLKYSRYSFAMENATEECKASAKYLTKSNGEDGVAHGIMQIMRKN